MWLESVRQELGVRLNKFSQSIGLSSSVKTKLNTILDGNQFHDIPTDESSIEDIVQAVDHHISYFWLQSSILQSGDINIEGSTGCTALMLASLWGHVDLVRMLLSRPEISVNKKTNEWTTALICAARNGMYKVVKLLLSRPDILINEAGSGGSALLWAIKNYWYGYQKEVIRALLSDPRLVISEYEQELMQEENIRERLTVRKYYEGANQELYEGVMSWDINTIQQAIKNGADVNHINEDWDSMFNYAIHMHNLEKAASIMRVFFENWFTKINQVDVDWETILLHVVDNKYFEDEIAILLIQYWAKIKSMRKLIKRAKERGRIKLLKFLHSL